MDLECLSGSVTAPLPSSIDVYSSHFSECHISHPPANTRCCNCLYPIHLTLRYDTWSYELLETELQITTYFYFPSTFLTLKGWKLFFGVSIGGEIKNPFLCTIYRNKWWANSNLGGGSGATCSAFNVALIL